MARIETWYKQDLKRPLVVHKHTDVFNQDSKGNLIGVEVYSDGEPVVLAGSISGYCLLADGTTVPAVGANRSGNKASVLIPQTAYGVPGPITITIKNVDGDNIATLCATVGIVRQSVSGNLVNPGSVVTDWSNDINAQLQAVQTAADNVGAIVAAPFDENTVYVAGNYVTNNGNLYRITADHAAGVTWADTAKEQCTVGSELSDLKSAITDVNENSLLGIYTPTTATFAKGRINALTGAINGADLAYKHIIINVSEGDMIVFYSCLAGNGTPYGYAFYDSNGNYLNGSVVSNESKKIIYAPQNASVFKYGMYEPKWDDEQYSLFTVINDSNFDFIKELINANLPINEHVQEISRCMPKTYSAIALSVVDGKYKNLQLLEVTLSAYEYATVTVQPDSAYRVTCYSSRNSAVAPIIYADSSGNYVGCYPVAESAGDILLDKEVIYTPSRASFMYVNNVKAKATLKVETASITNAEADEDYSHFTWNAIGDSITQNGIYMNEVKSILGLPFVNGGVSSSTLAINNTYLTGQSIVERVLAGTYNDADVWTIMGGLNDCLYKSALGQIQPAGSTFDKTTVYGALQAMCEYILNLREHPRLILITPTQSVRDTWSESTYPTTMAEIRQAVIDVGEYYSVCVFDAWAKSGISAFNIQKQTNPTTRDGVHLNTLGGDIFGEKLALVLKDELFGIDDDDD